MMGLKIYLRLQIWQFFGYLCESSGGTYLPCWFISREKKAHLHDVEAQNVSYCPWNVISVSSLGLLIDQNWLFHQLHGLRCAFFSRILPWWVSLQVFYRSGEYKGNASCICWAQVYSEFAGPNRKRDSLLRWENPLHCEVHSRRIALLGFLPTSPKNKEAQTFSFVWDGIWETQVVNALLDGNREIFHVNAYQSLVETTTNREFGYFRSYKQFYYPSSRWVLKSTLEISINKLALSRTPIAVPAHICRIVRLTQKPERIFFLRDVGARTTIAQVGSYQL